MFPVQLGNDEAAIADCEQALALDDSYTKALLKRAELYLKTEQYDDAVRDYEAAIEQEPTNRGEGVGEACFNWASRKQVNPDLIRHCTCRPSGSATPRQT